MRTLICLLSGFMICTAAFSQPPKKYKYQGVARNYDGTVIANHVISLRIGIHKGNAGGTMVYRETQSPTTNPFGVFNIIVGNGTVISGNISTISWSGNNYYQEVEMDTSGLGTTYISMGTSQFLSVPYSLSADTALNVTVPLILQNINTNDSAIALYATSLSNGPTIIAKNTGNGSGIEASSQTGLAGKFDGGVQISGNNGLTVNGNSFLNNGVTIGGTLIAPLITGGQANFSTGISASGSVVNGSEHVFGNLQVDGSIGAINTTLVNGTQGNFNTSVTTPSLTVNGSGHVTGKLQVDDSIGAIKTTLVNGTQGNFNTSVTTPSLTVNGSGHVTGNLQVNGNLSKGSGSFKIDHPLDPTNKFLYHSFVESPDMKNIYDGNIITDSKGEAQVELPSYFEALNRDFRYQLTVLGQFAQAIVAGEISNNKFQIKTDKPGVKVSWQVTGIRKDAYAESNRIIPEVEKNNDEKGKYLYPSVLGFGQEKKIKNN